MADNVSDLEHIPTNIQPVNTVEEAAAKLTGLFEAEEAPPEEGEAPAQEEQPQEAAEESPTTDEDEGEVATAPVEEEVEYEEEETETEEVEEVTTPPQPQTPSRHEIELAVEKEKLKHERLQAQEFLNQNLERLGDPKPPDPALAQEDTYEYVVQRAKYEADMAAKAEAASQLNALQDKQFDDFVTEQTEILKSGLPEVFDGDEGKAKLGKIYNYAIAQGYDEARLKWASAQDIMLLNKAMSFDEVQQKAPATKKKLQKAAPVLKAKAPSPKADPEAEAAKRARAKLKKDGSADSFAEMLLRDESFG